MQDQKGDGPKDVPRFVIRQIQKVFKHNGLLPQGDYVIEDVSIAYRTIDQIASVYHDMVIGETRTIVEGFEIARIA